MLNEGGPVNMEEQRDNHDKQTILLIDRAKAGDNDALGRLYGIYEKRLNQEIRIKLGKKLRGRLETQDLMQSVWKDVLSDMGDFRYKGSDSFFRWLRSCIIRKIQDKGRYFNAEKRNIDRENFIPLTDQKFPDKIQPKAKDPSPSRAAATEEELERLMGYLDKIPNGQRQALVLHMKEKKEFEEVAKIMNRSIGAVRKLYNRGIKTIARIMHREKGLKKSNGKGLNGEQ